MWLIIQCKGTTLIDIVGSHLQGLKGELYLQTHVGGVE